MSQKLKNIDFRFQNSSVKVIANRNYPKIELTGLEVGPFEEGNEYEVYYWIATELVSLDIVHFREEDTLDSTKLYKIQWKERVQAPGQISELSEDFYPKLRRYLLDMQNEVAKHPTKLEPMQELDRVRHLAWDIINSRLKKIVALSSGPIQSDQIVKKLSPEEKLIYSQLGKIINQWRIQILELKEAKTNG